MLPATALFTMYWGGSKWLDANLMVSSQSGFTSQIGAGLALNSGGSIYYTATHQTVHKMWWGGSQYLDANLMVSANSAVRVESATYTKVDANSNIYYVATI